MTPPAGDDEADTGLDVNAELGKSGVGALLRASRERLGEDLPDVARMLRIRYPYLEAIESGDYEALPGSTYAVGFIRAYSSHLGLDSEEVVRRFKAESSNGGTKQELSFPTPVPETGIPGGAIVFIGIVVAVLAYGGWYLSTTKDGFFAEMISPIPDRLSALLDSDDDKNDAPEADPTPAEEAAPAPETSMPEPSGESVIQGSPQPDSPVETTQTQTPESAPEATPETTQETISESVPEATGTTSVEPTLNREAEDATEAQTANAEKVVEEAAAPVTASAPPEITPPTPDAQMDDTPAPAAEPSASEVTAPTEVSAPTPEAAPEPAPESAPEPVSEPVSVVSAEPATPVETVKTPDPAPVVEPEPEVQAQPAPEPEPASEPASEPEVAEPEPVSEPASESAPEVVEAEPAPPTTQLAESEEDAANTGENETPTVETAVAPATASGPSRIVINASSDSWIQVRDDFNAELLFTRLLQAGDTYEVPNRSGLVLLTGNAGALSILVDGIEVPSIGGPGVVRRGVALDPGRLTDGTAVNQ